MKINSRQLYFFLACLSPVGKILLLPPRLAASCGNDLLLPLALQILLQAAAIFPVVLLFRENKSLFSLLSEKCGKIIGGILTSLVLLFSLFLATMPLFEQKMMLRNVFYDTLPSALYFAPFFLLSAYLCYKPIGYLGRTCDLVAPVAIVGFFGLMVLSAPSADFAALLPVGSKGAEGFSSGMVASFAWFFDPVLLLGLCGRVEYKKSMAWKAPFFSLVGGLALLFFFAVFYGIFQEISPRQTFAFAKISKYFSAVGVIGRIDYLFIILLSLAMVFYTALPLQAATAHFCDLFPKKISPLWFAIPVNLLFLVLMDKFTFYAETLMGLWTRTLSFLYPLFCLLLPYFLLLFRRNRERKTA